MPLTRVKICGITRAQDADAAAALGADALGLVFYPPSPRYLPLSRAENIVKAIPPFVCVVGLFVDATAETIERVLTEIPVDVLQFHGSETAAFCRSFDRPWLKALRVTKGMDLAEEAGRYSGARGILLDNWEQGMPGGTGRAFDWSAVDYNAKTPLVLAGGLHSGNVAEGITRFSPAAVDVSSGVESEPGKKDPAKIAAFVEAVRECDASRAARSTAQPLA